MKQVFNKLVRDNIPEIIRKSGEIPVTAVLSEEDYLKELNRKLDEEIGEYKESGELEELADILEVVYALCEAKGAGPEELHRIQECKRRERGGFSGKIFLISKE